MKTFFTFLLVLTTNLFFAQSKKEQIEVLTFQIDSLKNSNNLMKVSLNDQSEKNKQLETELISIKNKNRQLSKSDSLLRIDLYKLENKYDSLIKNQQSKYLSDVKHGILTNLVGEFHLEHIEGVQGANTMFDYYMKNGEWYSFYSSIVEGMRDGSEDKLNAIDDKFLHSLKIEVYEDLTIKLLQGSKILLEIPFIDSGMDFRISNSESGIHERIPELTRNTIFHNNNLILLANDSIDLNNQLGGSSLGLTASENLILSYSLKDGEFILEIFSTESIESNTLTFIGVDF